MKVISEQKLANSLFVKIIDQSRRIAADRWYIKIVCEVRMSLTDEHFANRHDDTPELSSAARRKMGDEITMEIVKERNFIDDAAKEEVIQDLLAGINDNVSAYLASEAFPDRLFNIRCRESIKQCAAKGRPVSDELVSDDDEPADFSACFRD